MSTEKDVVWVLGVLVFCLVFFFPNTSLLVSYFIHVFTDFTLFSRNQEL